jgi:hypothetical protein
MASPLEIQLILCDAAQADQRPSFTVMEPRASGGFAF